MSDYYDKQGNALTREGYSELLEREGWESTRVEITDVGDVQISTVWLGLDHQEGGGAPLIFETMQFGGAENRTFERYSTLEEAQAGHDAWVKRIATGECSADLRANPYKCCGNYSPTPCHGCD